jgi:uncharacterized membrane protein YuzA (DUF378 family)
MSVVLMALWTIFSYALIGLAVIYTLTFLLELILEYFDKPNEKENTNE